MSFHMPLPNTSITSSLLGQTAGAGPKLSARATTPTTGANGTSTANANSTSSLDTTFLSLLVQELQNQDPTAPMDSTAMVGQMISLNQLNQLTSINQTLSTAYPAQSSTTGTQSHALSATQAALRLLNGAGPSTYPAVSTSVSLPAF